MYRHKPDLASNREQRMRHRLEMQRAIADALGVPVTTIRLPSVRMLQQAWAEAMEALVPSKPNS